MELSLQPFDSGAKMKQGKKTGTLVSALAMSQAREEAGLQPEKGSLCFWNRLQTMQQEEWKRGTAKLRTATWLGLGVTLETRLQFPDEGSPGNSTW